MSARDHIGALEGATIAYPVSASIVWTGGSPDPAKWAQAWTLTFDSSPCHMDPCSRFMEVRAMVASVLMALNARRTGEEDFVATLFDKKGVLLDVEIVWDHEEGEL